MSGGINDIPETSPLSRIENPKPVDQKWLNDLAKKARARAAWWRAYCLAQRRRRVRIINLPL